MNEIDKEAVGAFVAALRKDKGLTQKELAEQLFVSDKAVSKWERGLSLPDVALLQPLGDILGVTLSELLQGRRNQAGAPPEEMEELLTGVVVLSAEEQCTRRTKRAKWKRTYVACMAVCAGEIGLLLALGFSVSELMNNVLLVAILSGIFGAWLCFWAKETLPAYYDQNKINFYSDGVFRMNLAGVRFNNSNWPHILNAMRGWLLGAAVVYPLVWLVLHRLLPGNFSRANVELALTLFAALGFFLPAYIAGKRYE